jgi:hypothetical protein
MDSRTGKLHMLEEGQEVPEGLVDIFAEDMTKLQAESMQVSKHDNRSTLGKKFTALRKDAIPFKASKSQKKNMTRKELKAEKKRYNLKNSI